MPSSTHWGDPIPSPGSPPTTGAALVWNGSTWVADSSTYRKTATLIVDADVSASAAIVTTKLSQAAWATYTPTLTASPTNPTLGTGSVATGRWTRQGDRLIVARIYIKFGTSGTNAGSGNYTISLPATPAANIGDADPIGSGFLTDTGVPNYYLVVPYKIGSGDGLQMIGEAVSIVSDASPFVWGVSDSMQLMVAYESTS